jgi:hypothetical protein|tara:strand:+ start:71 stop:340 length:270 start_codon:yes stop_codon:yes gene_type:complete
MTSETVWANLLDPTLAELEPLLPEKVHQVVRDGLSRVYNFTDDHFPYIEKHKLDDSNSEIASSSIEELRPIARGSRKGIGKKSRELYGL